MIDATVFGKNTELAMNPRRTAPRASGKRLAPIFALVLTASAWAAESIDEARTVIEGRLTLVSERLALTDEQVERIEPVLRKSLEAQGELLAQRGFSRDGQQRRGGDRPNLREMRTLVREMDAIRETALEELGEVLDEKQLREYAEIQEERKAELRRRMRRHR